MELQRSSDTEDELKVKGLDLDMMNKVNHRENNAANKMKKRWRLGCFRSDYGQPTIDESDGVGNIDTESATTTDINHAPTHLLIMVNGIVGRYSLGRSLGQHHYNEDRPTRHMMLAVLYGTLMLSPLDVMAHCTSVGLPNMSVLHMETSTISAASGSGSNSSAQDWRFAAKQFLKKYPEDLIVHCSECNYSMLTFDGVDVMGRRLAAEVISVINRHPNLQKISFIGHSLGGVIARYTIAELYSHEFTSKDQESREHVYDGYSDSFPGHNLEGKVAGLEPVNFITVATPHLGSRGHRQVPLFGGVYALEKLASNISWFLGRTGKQLFLMDCDNPLLLQMVSDHEDLKFLSALQSFKRRVVYANVHFDYLVGWSTSSIRRRNELPKRQDLSKNGTYPHVLKVETAKVSGFPQKGAAEVQVKSHKIEDMEETMIRALTKLSWERVDISFKGSRQRYFAHSTIQVKGSWINSDGADVIQHIIDNFQL